jgi:hypothetical protein
MGRVRFGSFRGVTGAIVLFRKVGFFICQKYSKINVRKQLQKEFPSTGSNCQELNRDLV